MSLENSEIKEFNIIDGEPFLYPHLKELLEFLSKFNKRIVIMTNGVLLKQCNIFLNNSFFIKHPENFKDLQMDIKSFKSYNEILKFLNKRNKICNGCNFWSCHPREQSKYNINEVLIQ